MVNAYGPESMTIMAVKGLHLDETFGKRGAFPRAK
jgi:hypothetical protein